MSPLLLLFITIILSSLFVFLFISSITTKKSTAPLPPCPKGWPILGNLPQLGQKPHHTLQALSKTYGPLFRLRLGSIDVVVASNASTASAFLRTHDSNFSNRPPNSGAEHIAYNYQDLVFAPYGPRWRYLRRLCSLHLFSAKALEDLRCVREQELGLLVESLVKVKRKTVNVGQAANACATNALARATVGRRVFTEEEEGEAGEFQKMVVELMRLAGVFNVGDFVPWLRPLDVQGVVKKMKELHRRYDEFFDKIIEEHRTRDVSAAGGDFLSVMLALEDVEDEGGQLNDTNIKALLLNLFTAGTDTTSSTVEWVLAELIRHPDILAMAQSELDTVIGRGRLVAESDLHKLPLMQAIIKETFRLHPPTPLSLPRTAFETCQVAGYQIPKSATLLVNVWAIARDPEVWPNALEFDPHRFLPGGKHAHVDVKGSDFELIPFGAGRRVCAGMSLGLKMVHLMAATLVHAFDWALPEGMTAEKLNMEEAYGLTLQRAVPLMANPIPRLNKDAYGVIF
ncbi:putative flavonoid 3'-monooxygenase [Dioscorea sansibarensis]